MARLAPPWPARYELLDGLRGLACLGVLLHHLGIESIGHYCVMIFFVISGYCITAAAESAIRARLTFKEFMRRRVRRIFPPYLAAVGFFALTRLLKHALHPSMPAWHAGLIQWLQNLTLTQWLSDLFHPVNLPGDNSTLFVAAFWSLNYEEQFYLAVAALAAAGMVSFRVGVLALMVVGMAWDVAHPGGPITGVFIEYWPHFALGSCLFFSLAGSSQVFPRWIFLNAMVLLTIVAFCKILPWQGLMTEQSQRVYVEFSVLACVSFLLVVLRPYSESISRSPLWRPVALIGTISYSLYLIHQFNLNLVETAVRYVLPTGAPGLARTAFKVFAHLLLATGFWYIFERPFLNRRPATKADDIPALEPEPLVPRA
jgi:peptidoglycan/LPS O-acetylase OafA/YrhL